MSTRLHKSKTLKVYKSKQLNKARLTDYTLNDYQVFLMLITKLGKVDNMGKYLQQETLERSHTITAKEFSKEFNVDLSYAYRILQQAAKKLSERALTIEDDISIQHIPVCALAKYNKNSGNLSVEFNQHIMPHLAQVSRNFVIYNLKDLANFGSLYTTRLYELICQFAKSGELKQSIEQLRKIFDVGTRYKAYRDFKIRTFAHAVDEINAAYEIDLTYKEYNELNEEVKPRQKVTAIIFRFKPTFTRRAVNPKTGNEVNIYIKPRKKSQLTPEENQKQEAKKTKQKEYRDRHKANQLKTKTEQQELSIEIAKRPNKSAEEIRAIIDTLIREEKLTETQATILAIKLKLI